MWNNLAIKRLLESLKGLKAEIQRGRGATKWRDIARTLNISSIDADACKAKWSALQRQYRDFKDSQNRTGGERREFQ